MTRLLQELVTDQAERRPEAIALAFGNERLTYGELEETSNRLARLLREAGCKRGDRICFLIPKSPAAIISILGILKADCMHVPLDTSSPSPRLEKIIDACEPRFILAGGDVVALLDDLTSKERNRDSVHIGWMTAGRVGDRSFKVAFSADDLQAQSGMPLEYENATQDPAHILFTSGSTGAPKGVVITHANVIHFVEWATRYFGMNSSDRVSGHPPLHFDLSTFDIFGAFAAGAELHLVTPELNLMANKLADFIRSSQLTQWFSVPSVLSYMAKFDVVAPNDFPDLKRLIWCGEVLPTPALIYWMKRLPGVTFTNLYGPTEATIASSYYTVPECPTDERASIPIGTACTGEELLVLNEALDPVPQGEIGDLYIRGLGLSPGYWKDTEKTCAAFLPNRNSSDPTDRIYRTGDLAKVEDDGLVYFLGRADTQIKSRGYRIELGEIEAALNALGKLEECAVVAIDSVGFEGKIICCAYASEQNKSVTHVALRKELAAIIPTYMLPSRWMAFDELPKNANGKIDRPKLRQRFMENGIRAQQPPKPQDTGSVISRSSNEVAKETTI